MPVVALLVASVTNLNFDDCDAAPCASFHPPKSATASAHAYSADADASVAYRSTGSNNSPTPKYIQFNLALYCCAVDIDPIGWTVQRGFFDNSGRNEKVLFSCCGGSFGCCGDGDCDCHCDGSSLLAFHCASYHSQWADQYSVL